ncbi:NAD-dependent epimerase/dehydratase family protein, partial [Salinisphaera sp.]|uniref:NAD-dependent epimerase/dehydratase family protein n=1 Tax=Salinisphaera sp. TaxID=1914330 RepID=UPI002D7A3872
MKERALITGGAGFIGAYLARELLDHGYRVRVLDNLIPQVHGARRQRPGYLSAEVELRRGDIRDRDAVTAALDGVDVVFHYAAAVGVGQSMYQIAHYTEVNNLGTAVLLEALAENPVRRLVVASSMSLYGEGQYRSVAGEPQPARRTREQLHRREWEPVDSDGEPLIPMPTAETKAPDLASVYALSKFDQEQ